MTHTKLANLQGLEFTPNQTVYAVEHITKRYGRGKAAQSARPANLDISLEIKQGEIFGLLGSNGAGKSTLIKQMVNLLSPSEGRISLFGVDIAQKPEIVTRKVAYMPQKPNALLDLTAEEAIYFTGHMRGMSRSDAKKAAAQLVEQWGLGEVRRKAVRNMSGGQNRLVSLAITLVGDLPVMILDEPTNELDPAFRRQVWDYLKEQNTSQGTTIILVTHNVQEAEHVIGRVAIMSRGRMVGMGRVSELKSKIDQSVRLELFIKPDRIEVCESQLVALEQARQLKPYHWVVLVPRENAEEDIYKVLGGIRLDNLEDFRVQTASLEDVYMAFTGRTIEDEDE
ncbi:ABC transporter ATP-binding protein [Candidatus Chlorohelix sp.]|uniref:ABC transporter ATP-binding protein n=1 Tax=Candidatus Chlorohelix sp. TaxID=3139201 RepID=UPI0030671FF3